MVYRPRLRTPFGCLRCRQRRKACDRVRPKCSECVQCGFDDCYLQQDWPTINFATIARIANERRKLSSSQIATKYRHVDQEMLENLANMTPELPIPLSAADMCISYLINEIYKGQNEEASLAASKPFTIRAPVMLVQEDMPLARRCLEACAFAAFSRVHHLKNVDFASAILYGDCVRRLNTVMNDPSIRMTQETMISIHILDLCMESPWIAQCGALSHLIQILGPEEFSRPEKRVLLENSRLTLIIAALKFRKRSFLEGSNWKIFPWWNFRKEHLSFKHFLLNILADIPGILEDFDRLSKKQREDADRTAATNLTGIHERIDLILQQLHSWRQKWEVDKPRSCWTEAQTLNTLNSTPSTICPVLFDGYHSASEILYFNLSLIIICRTIISLKPIQDAINYPLTYRSPIGPWFHSNPICPGVFPVRSFQERAFISALEICRCVGYVVFGELFGLGVAMNALPPINVAHRVLGSLPEGQWLQSIYNMLTK